MPVTGKLDYLSLGSEPMGVSTLDHKQLYRLPWSMPDNAIAWYEPTSMCNLACNGCYRENVKNSHKPLDVVRRELDTFLQQRNSDCMNIAGGDPLMHPQIVEIVGEVKARGWKPILVTNGILLIPELLKDLKRAGAFGFTFHVDSKQGRPGKWRGKSEQELNELRYEYASMLAGVGDLVCTFDCTVYEDTLREVAGLIDWAHRNIDIVQNMVFITIRRLHDDMPYDWMAAGKPVALNEVAYSMDQAPTVELQSTDLLAEVRKTIPEFQPSAYLNGTVRPDTFKWMLTERVGTRQEIYGYPGPKFMELVMSTHHFATGKYLSHLPPRYARSGKSILLLWPLDRGVRKAAGRLLASLVRNPLRLFQPTYFQTVMFIQPVDILPGGEQNMCDGCPDITIWEDRLVWSCRLGELNRFGTLLTSVPQETAMPAPMTSSCQ
jgi:pyruvate-formate lyase-activating enzyme